MNKLQIQFERMQYAAYKIEDAGYDILSKSITMIRFYYNDEIVQLFPYTGWHTGKSIEDGRGLNNLLKQLK